MPETLSAHNQRPATLLLLPVHSLSPAGCSKDHTRENGLRTRTIFNPLYALLFPSMNYPAHLVNSATVPVKLEPDHDTALAPGPTAIKKKRRQLVGPYPALLPPPLTTFNSMRWLPVSYNLFSSRLPLID